MSPIVERMLQVTYFSGAPVSSGTGTLEGVDIETTVSEELSKLPPCESGEWHEQGKAGHVPEQYAAFLMIPGCGHDRMICLGWVEASTGGRFTHFTCSVCKGQTPMGEMIFVPLDMTHP